MFVPDAEVSAGSTTFVGCGVVVVSVVNNSIALFMNWFTLIRIISFIFLAHVSIAQTGDRIELIEPAPDYLIGTRKDGKEVRKLIGNVHFRQKATLLSCDSAYQNIAENTLETFGNVKIVQGDTLTITGNYGTYDGKTKFANMRGNVVLVDSTMTLYTEQLDYDMTKSLAFYPDSGRIVDGENILTSRQGYYDTRSKFFFFKDDVVLINPQYTLKSDTLQYNSLSKIAYFKGPTEIIEKTGTLYATDGQYNTISQASIFRGRTRIDYGKYTLTGDSVYYDKLNEIGLARWNVVLEAKEDSTIIEGDVGRYFGRQGISKVYGNALMKNIVSSDTLFLTADTLVSVDDSVKQTRKVFAYNKVKIFKSDLQSKCDSLLYNFSDSTIYFYRDPVLWSNENQMLGDSVHVQLANGKVDRLFMKSNAFVINQDTLKNFNQLKGRTMVAYFKTSKLDQVHVNGNGESLYFALDDNDTTMLGMNKMECGRMTIVFKESKVSTIKAYNNPDALFIPPHEIEEPVKRLKGFNWRIAERPKKKDVLVRNKNKIL